MEGEPAPRVALLESCIVLFVCVYTTAASETRQTSVGSLLLYHYGVRPTAAA